VVAAALVVGDDAEDFLDELPHAAAHTAKAMTKTSNKRFTIDLRDHDRSVAREKATALEASRFDAVVSRPGWGTL
jgi:hypothetical protein